jgi:hypothetical protein
MTDYAAEFENNRLVYIPNALDIDTVNQLNNEMHVLHIQEKTTMDDQCPLSHSYYNAPEAEKAGRSLTEPLSKLLNLDLDYAYCYARIYQPGEILAPHTDRESCEISATMTLGHHGESDIWPIYMGKDADDNVGTPITIGIGDMVMYHGRELNHWRNAYQGKWQTQVFFHYVQKDGEFAGHANDSIVVPK